MVEGEEGSMECNTLVTLPLFTGSNEAVDE